MTKRIILYFIFITFTACNLNSNKEIAKEKVDSFNSELAKKYGADDYGMKKYVIAFLKRGPNRNQDSITKVKLQNAHLENINKLAEQGELVLAGPFFGNDDLRGIYVFDVTSIEEATKLTETDPAIKAGSLKMELKEWYGSAALLAVNDLHNQIAKKNP